MFDGFPRSVLEWLFDEYLVNMFNAERNRAIMRRRFIDGATYERISEEFDMSDWQVKHIVKDCVKRLKDV